MALRVGLSEKSYALDVMAVAGARGAFAPIRLDRSVSGVVAQAFMDPIREQNREQAINHCC